MDLCFSQAAQIELDDAFAYREGKELGLGYRFTASLLNSAVYSCFGIFNFISPSNFTGRYTPSLGRRIFGGSSLKTFLDTHTVEYRSGGLLSFDKSTADLADEARKWTLVVECWR